MHQLRISVTTAEGTRTQVFGTSPIFLGRFPSNEVQLVDPRASRLHTQISWGDGLTLVVTDMGSGNRTLVVDGHGFHELLARRSLDVPSGEVELQLGDTRIRARLERMRVSPVPVEVIAAARAAVARFRRDREREHRTDGLANGCPRRALDALETSLRSAIDVRDALLVETPATPQVRTSRTPDDAQTALLAFLNELIRSLSLVVEELDVGGHSEVLRLAAAAPKTCGPSAR